MPGLLRRGRVVVPGEREASTLYNKGAYGTPQPGGGLELDLLEALHLAEQGRLVVEDAGRKLSPADLFHRGAVEDPAFGTRYVLYRDLRQRTYVVRASDLGDFNVYPPGSIPGRTASRSIARALAERVPFTPSETIAEADRVAATGKKPLLAIVDEEGDLTYYRLARAQPKGRVPSRPRDLVRGATATLLEDRVVVGDEDVARRLHGEEFYGRPLGPALQLSFAETVFLVEEGGLRVVGVGDAEAIPASALRARARGLQGDFDLRYAVFEDLKRRDLVVKTGFKFGTHLRAYERGPEEGHAPFLVHAVSPGAEMSWPEAAGFIRVAHGVRKSMLFAVPGPEGVAYLELKWTKP